MATTRIISMHVNQGKTIADCLTDRIDYSKNPDKTQGGELISAYECDPKTADAEFLYSKRQYQTITGREQRHNVIAYQVRQSFKPGEITPEEANHVGYEFAERFLKGRHAFFVATHTDKKHIHNHIIWNSTTLDCKRKFRDFLGSGRAVARLSDAICTEHRLSVIADPKRGKNHYGKWLGNKAKPSHRELLCGLIDAALLQKPDGFDTLLTLLRDAGCEVRRRGNTLSLRHPDRKGFIRLSSIENYTEDELRAVLAGEKEHTPRKKRTQATRKKNTLLIDIEAKLQAGKGGGYERWAKVFNVKQMAQTYNYLREHGLLDYAELEEKANRLLDTLRSFKVDAKIINITQGPSVTRFELQPGVGIKVSKITGLSDDIALSLAAPGIRIEAPIPGKSAIGIEIPNKEASPVPIREVLESDKFQAFPSKTAFALGKDIAGSCVVADIAKFPHVLIAGQTGSGKSVCINSLILSILFKARPDEVKLIRVDPKMVELGIYNGIPHLLIPVVTDPKHAAGALNWAVGEMQNRYNLLKDNNVRNLKGYNALMEERGEPESKLPEIVIIIDEFADLMMAAKSEVEDAINRLAALARAAGMYLVIATQRPTVNVITGVIKANIPSRIAFNVTSQIDSRTILDSPGAEKLLGRGDMLYNPSGSMKPMRIQGNFVSDQEIERVIDFIKGQYEACYDEEIIENIQKEQERVNANLEHNAQNGGEADEPSARSGEARDELFFQAVEMVLDNGQASVAMFQRRFKIGYQRAARLIDQMEERRIIGPYEGTKPRQVLITRQEFNEMRMNAQE